MSSAEIILKLQLERLGYRVKRIRERRWMVTCEEAGVMREQIFRLLFPECHVIDVRHEPCRLIIRFSL